MGTYTEKGHEREDEYQVSAQPEHTKGKAAFCLTAPSACCSGDKQPGSSAGWDSLSIQAGLSGFQKLDPG